MELSTFSTITGLLVLLVAFPMLLAGNATVAFVRELMRNDVTMRVTGAVIVVLTVLTLEQGYRIGTDAAGLIRLMAWLGLIKGITAAWSPKTLTGISEGMLGNASLRPVFGIIALVMGGLLLYGAQLV